MNIYGAWIPVNGKRPDWLDSEELIKGQDGGGGYTDHYDGWELNVKNVSWDCVTMIALPADHPHYHPKPIAKPSPSDTVTVGVVSTSEARKAWEGSERVAIGSDASLEGWLNACYHYGIITAPTRAQTISTKTGILLPDVEAVLAAIEEGE